MSLETTVLPLLPILDEKLLALLRSLSPEEWEMPTVAKLWRVKDVAGHLLDGNIRVLSMLRDGYAGEKTDAATYEELVAYLNRLNADWVQAMKRVSPQMLVMLHEITGPLYCQYYASLDPNGIAPWPVVWAGETESRNWMHIAREYTEKFLHQQQIREAVNRPGLMTKEFFYPFMHIFLLALPHQYRAITEPDGCSIGISITGDAGGDWTLLRQEQRWVLEEAAAASAVAALSIPQEYAWKLFSKSLRPADIAAFITITGEKRLVEPALAMVSVMA